jgi:cytochrome c-type biogenesis protein CcmF
LFLPLMALLMLVLASAWWCAGRTPRQMAGSMLTPVLIGSAILAPVAGFIVGDFDWPVLTASALAAWVVLAGCVTSSTRPATRA